MFLDVRGGDKVTYGEKVLSRLNIPGLALLILGAVLVYTSSPLTRRLFPEKQEIWNLVFKGIGCVVCLIGALLLLNLIG